MPADDSSLTVPDLDPVASRRWLSMPRGHSPWLNEEVARRMEARLDWIKQRPALWVHWSARLGGMQAHDLLVRRYPQARCVFAGEQAAAAAADIAAHAQPRWRRWLRHWWPATPPAPLLPGTADLLWANMSLHWYAQPQAVLRQWQEALRTGGFVMFSCLGPDTLRELQQFCLAHQAPAPLHPLTDMHDWGDMLVEAGFAQPVMDMERLTLTYASAERMMQDLRDWGRNLHRQRGQRTVTRRQYHQWLDRLEAGMPRNAAGELYLTFELIYGHAIKPEPRVRMAGETAVSLQDMRAMLRPSQPLQSRP
jgi:malonyl-CoA O-methyltransferase